jgi:GntR family transcriptional repressor for pyruvate dehydrogenase complex
MVHKSGDNSSGKSSHTVGASRPTQRPGKVSEFVVSAIRDYIATKDLKPGAKLPPERFFIDQLAVSRSSVREGLRALTALEIVDVRHGDGMYVGQGADPARSARGRGFDATEENALRNLVETRLGIEFAAVRATTQRATDEDFDALSKLLDEQERALKRNRRWEPLAFELAVAEMSGNSWLSEVEFMLRDAWLTLSVGLLETVGRHQEWLAEHRAILASMRARNVLQAERLLVAHLSLERFEEDLKSSPASAELPSAPSRPRLSSA